MKALYAEGLRCCCCFCFVLAVAFCLCLCFSGCHSERSERTCFLPFLALISPILLARRGPEGPGFSQAVKAAPQEPTALPQAGVEAQPQRLNCFLSCRLYGAL